MELLIVLGLFVGIISSFLGIGGGVIIVPTFYYLFPALPPSGVIGTSLAIIFINSLVNVFNFVRAGKVPHVKIALPLAIGLALGIFIGGKLSMLLPALVIKKIFGATAIAIAAKMLLGKNPAEREFEIPSLSKLFFLGFISTLGGVLAGVTGLGGGIIVIPLLIIVGSVPYSHLSVYSNTAMAFGTLVGVITLSLVDISFIQSPFPDYLMKFQVGYINWGCAIIVAVGASITSRVGVKLTQIIDAKTAKKILGMIFLLLGLKILIF